MPGRVETDRGTINHTPVSNQACDGVRLFFFNEYLNASFLFSMLNDKRDTTYRYVDYTLWSKMNRVQFNQQILNTRN